MDSSFDFSKLLKNHAKKHKSKPTQFVSVAGGVQKRLENNLKYRKSTRFSVFDKIRNLTKCESPAPTPKKVTTAQHRRQQLEKWKEEKEKKKKEMTCQKKKPFVVSVVRAPLKFVLPPPAKPVPASSGRVTRSQSARNNKQQKEPKPKQAQSFAPANATFCPPKLKTFDKLIFGPGKGKKDKKAQNITFDPVLPNSSNNDNKRQTRSRTVKQNVEPKPTRKVDMKTKEKATKPQKDKTDVYSLSSSSSSDMVQSPILMNKSRRSLPPAKSPNKAKTPRKSIIVTKSVTPKNAIPKSESSSEERLRSPKSPNDVVEVPMTPQQIADEAKRISPCVTMSRGKDNARKEMKQKLEEGLLDEDASDMDSVDHFRKQLASETKRMTEMCETWDKILEQTVLPEPVQELVLSGVGQARLLMSQKMQQFASLVERCARPAPGQALVTPADLHGFWDMIFMQVENVDMRFKKLEELRARGWCDEQPKHIKRKKQAVKKSENNNVRPTGGASRLREMIEAARRAKKEQEKLSIPPTSDNKTFEAGFFCVRSPVRSPAPGTPTNRPSLLKVVLSSEAKKASASKNASFAMLRASVLGKNVECDGVAPLPQTPPPNINLHATPGRSILKQANSTVKKSKKKSIKVVLFDNQEADESLMELDNVQKKNSRKKLTRQDATEGSPVMTRSRRKSIVEEEKETPRRSTRNGQVLNEIESNIERETPKRSTRRRRSAVQAVTT